MMEWSEMLPEILDIIAQKYITCYEDYPSFAGVCKSWHLAAARTYHNSNGPPSRLPSLVLADKWYDHESRELFLLSNKSIRKIRLPEADGKACMSSCGWLLTVGRDLAAQLINPLSHEIINLPKVDSFPEFIPPYFWDSIISKVVLLLESKLVFVIRNYSKLGFCHFGDTKWTSVKWTNHIQDITFYNEHVYRFDGYSIQAWNINGKDPAVMVDVAMVPEDAVMLPKYMSCIAYIVGLDDGERKELLLIFKVGIEDSKIIQHFDTKSFHVLAYDLQSRNWSEVKDFGTKTLFVGSTSSFWVEDTTGVIKGNCIYYTNDKGDDIGIYNLLDGTIEPYSGGKSLIHVRPKMWLQSM